MPEFHALASGAAGQPWRPTVQGTVIRTAVHGPSFTGQTSTPTGVVNGAIKCQQISGGDGYATMANGVQTYLFAFGPLSGLADIKAGLPGTEFPTVFNTLPVGGCPYVVRQALGADLGS